MESGIKLIHTNSEFHLEVDGNELKEISKYSITSLPDGSVKLDVSIERQSKNIICSTD